MEIGMGSVVDELEDSYSSIANFFRGLVRGVKYIHVFEHASISTQFVQYSTVSVVVYVGDSVIPGESSNYCYVLQLSWG